MLWGVSLAWLEVIQMFWQGFDPKGYWAEATSEDLQSANNLWIPNQICPHVQIIAPTNCTVHPYKF